MKWERLGLVFNPSEYKLPGSASDFAQSPQALVLSDRIRVFFSTREIDSTGKYLSQVAFVDFDYDWRIVQVSKNFVIELGELGCFDEHGIFPLNVVSSGGMVFGYIGGWTRRVSVSVDGAIGLAVSRDDGVSFTRLGNGPILGASLHEPFLVGDPFVKQIDGLYYMWYIFGTRWIDGPTGSERVYKIGLATSNDGRIWRRTDDGVQLITDRLGADECQALPTVAKLNGRYLMVFCFREALDFRANSENSYRLGCAFSDDLLTWTRSDSELNFDRSPIGWDSEMLCYPHLVQFDDSTYMLYNGNQFGRGGFGVARLLST
jgi:hypothetical protein